MNTKTKIIKNNLKKRVTSHEGEVRAYSIDLDDCILCDEKKAKIANLKNELRAILRSKNNLEEAIQMINLLECNLKNNDSYALNISNRSLFISATILYGACFVRGGADKRVPLSTFSKHFDEEEEKIHKGYMTYRHKLLCHLDEDHDVRTDLLEWDLIVCQDELKPHEPHLGGSKVMMEMGHKNNQWIEHMKMLIREINRRKIEITFLVNELLGDVEIV